MTEEELLKQREQELALQGTLPPAPPPSVETLDSQPEGDAIDWASQRPVSVSAPETSPTPAVNPVKAAATAKPEPPPPQGDAESTGTRVARAALGSVGVLTESIGAMLAAKSRRRSAHTTDDLLSVSRQGTADIASGAQATEAHRTAANREARADYAAQTAYGERQHAHSRQVKEEAFSDEAMDPNSNKSKALREELRRAYPEYVTGLGDDFEKMSVRDFASQPHPGIEKAKSDSAAERQARLLGQRGAQIIETERVKQSGRLELEGAKNEGRIQLKRTPKAGAGGHGGPAFDPAETLKALEAPYKGHVPPDVVQQVKLAAALRDPAKRTAALERILAAAPKAAQAATTSATKASVEAAKAYEKSAGEAESVLEDIQRTRDLLRANHVDMDHYHGEDVPGMGRVKSVLPQWMLSNEGQALRAQILGNMSTYLKSLSGKAASDTERRQIQEIVGSSSGSSVPTLLRGLKRLEGIAQAQKARAAAYYRPQAQEYEGNRPEMAPAAPGNAPPAEHAAPSGVRVRDPKTGQTGRFTGTAEKAKAKGLEVL
jgi:hypothetical protein